MNEHSEFNAESTAVQSHLTIMQGVIQRMAENSRSCKVWCVTLVSAIMVLVARIGEADHVLIALAPAVLFYVLDAYYLALERGLRESYNNFVSKVRNGKVSSSDLYTVVPIGSTWRGTLWAMFKSFSVLPFYAVVAATILLAWRFVI